MIGNKRDVADCSSLKNVRLACDAGGGGRLQNKRGRASEESERRTNGIAPRGCAINDSGHRESGAHRTLQSAAVLCSARQPKQKTKKTIERTTHMNLILGDVAAHDAQQDTRSPVTRCPRAHVHAGRRGRQPVACRCRKADRSALQLSWPKVVVGGGGGSSSARG